MDRDEKERLLTGGEGFRRRAALEIVDDILPVVHIIEEVADGERDIEARSMERIATKRCPVLAGNRRRSSTGAQACSVCVGIDDLMHGSAAKLVREMHGRMG
jgi:hypothetical protein